MGANGAVVVWAVAVIFAPGLLYATFRRCTPLVLAAGAMLTMVLVALIAFLVSSSGHSPLPWLRALGALLVLALVLAFVLAVRRVVSSRRAHQRPAAAGSLRAVAMVAVLVLLGTWMLAPLALVLHRHGVEFGLLTNGNADEANYVLLAQNMADSGFRDSHHVANLDLGALTRTNYVGSITMLVWLSAITPLSPVQVALASMAVAACLAAAALWALADEIWPTLPPVAALPGTVIVSASGLAAYSYASYFLGADLGLAAASTLLAGVVSLSRRWSWPAATAVAAGGGYGVYAYGHIGLVVVAAALPATLVVALIASGLRGVTRSLARVALPLVAGVTLALPDISEAYDLVRAQSGVQAGWPLPPMNPFRALFWPPGIGLPSAETTVVITWVIALAPLLAALVYAARKPAERRSAVLAGVVLLGAVVVVAGSAWIYGAERYQAWKMLQLLMPVALVAALPAVSLVVVKGARIGGTVLTALAGAALLGPWLQWQGVLASPDTAVLTSNDLAEAADSIRDRDIVAINVRLGAYNETMMAGTMLGDTAVVFSEVSYYPPLASTQTCTLTLRSMVSPDDDTVIALSGDYVLVERPSACLVRR